LLFSQTYLKKEGSTNENSDFVVKDNVPDTFNVSVYPNPVKDYLNIEINNLSSGIAEIYDLNGKLLGITEIRTGYGILSTSELSNGLYVVKISGTNGKSAVQKILVNK
tara:strand:- start:120695 stop:121018 length:324 start_codon:yes stop_codon:yes gene_type:complete